MCCYIGKVKDIVVIVDARSALEVSERQRLLVVDCEDPDGLVSGLVAWYDLVSWFLDKDGEAFTVDYSLANRLGVKCASPESLK